MIGTLWKCRMGKVYILKEIKTTSKNTSTKTIKHYVFMQPSGNTLTLRDFFVDRGMTKIT
jgi:hypothetical protein